MATTATVAAAAPAAPAAAPPSAGDARPVASAGSRAAVTMGRPAPGPLAAAPAVGPDAPIVCVVDSGIRELPALAGRVVARDAVTADPAVDDPGSDHGTLVAAAVLEVWPQARLVSVRATTNAAAEVRDQVAAVDRCGALGAAVINVSIGGPVPGPESVEAMRAAVGRAGAAGRDVVVAAGNTPGGVVYPAVALGDLAVVVDAVDGAGARCSFASTGPSVTVGAPACPFWLPTAVAGTWAPVSGSSVAAPQVAATLAALHVYAPGLGAAGRRAALTGLPGGVLDQAEVLRRAGRGDLVPRAPRPVPRMTAVQRPIAMPTIPAPSLRIRFGRRGATVSVRRSPVGVRLTVRGRGRALTARSSTLSVPRAVLRHRRVVSVVVADRTGRPVLRRRVRVPARAR